MHKTKLFSSDISNTSYFSKNVDLCNREADWALPSPRSRFSIHSTLWLLLSPVLQPACGLQLDRTICRRMKCIVLRLWGANSTEQTSKRKRSGRSNCFLFGRCSCVVTSSFCSLPALQPACGLQMDQIAGLWHCTQY